MSHTINHLKKLRLQRSELAVPGSSPEMIDKAANSAADFVFLDIEDAVAPPDKERARKNIIQALNDIDWRAKGKTVSVRINGLDTHYMYRDVVDVMEQAGDRLDTILVPKVGVPADLYMVEAMVNQIEMAKGFKTRVGLEALIETALGMANVEAIHPSQIALANDVFSPPEKEVTRARRILEVLKEAEALGKGAAALDGKMIDAASERMARNVLVVSEAIERASQAHSAAH
ncbi:MAG: CoA ester lyase [Mesorhizobium sp.]|nr:MAG: CoA ester lyase [Mesorhizobium sp.]